jgi:hypothetical protein
MQWRPLLPKGGGLIQVDIGGHPPIPIVSHTYSILAFLVLIFTFVSRFLGTNLLGPF